MTYKNSILVISTIFFYLTIFAIVLIVGTRDSSVGSDTSQYLEYYLSQNNGANSRSLEFGFEILARALNAFSFSSQFFLIVIASLTIFLLTLVGKSEIENKFFLLTLLFITPITYSLFINVIRQGLGFGVFVYYVLFSKNNNRCLLWSLIAISFHYSAAIFIPVYFIAIRFSLKCNIYIWIVLFVFGVAINYSNLLSFGQGAVGDYFDYYINYFDSTDDVYQTGFKLSFFSFSVLGMILSVALFKRNKYLTIPKAQYNLIRAFFAFNAVGNLFWNVPYTDRFFSWSWMLVPYIVYFLACRNKIALYGTILSFPIACVFLFYNIVFAL